MPEQPVPITSRKYVVPWGLMCPGRPQTPCEGNAQDYSRVGPEGTQILRSFDNGTCLRFGPLDPVDEFENDHPFVEQVLAIDNAIKEVNLVRNQHENSGWTSFPAENPQGEEIRYSNIKTKYCFNNFRKNPADTSMTSEIEVEFDLNNEIRHRYKQVPSLYASCSKTVSYYSTASKSDVPGDANPGKSHDTRFGVGGRASGDNAHTFPPRQRGGHNFGRGGGHTGVPTSIKRQFPSAQDAVEAYRSAPKPHQRLAVRNAQRSARLRAEDEENLSRNSTLSRQPPHYQAAIDTPEGNESLPITTPVATYGYPQPVMAPIQPVFHFPVPVYYPIGQLPPQYPHYNYQNNSGEMASVPFDPFYTPNYGSPHVVQSGYVMQQNVSGQPELSADPNRNQNDSLHQEHKQPARVYTIANPTGQPINAGSMQDEPARVASQASLSAAPLSNEEAYSTQGRHGLAASAPGSRTVLSSKQQTSSRTTLSTITPEHLTAASRSFRSAINLRAPPSTEELNIAGNDDDDEDEYLTMPSSKLSRLGNDLYTKMLDEENQVSRARGDAILQGDRYSGEAMMQERSAIPPAVPPLPSVIPPTPHRFRLSPGAVNGAPPPLLRHTYGSVSNASLNQNHEAHQAILNRLLSEPNNFHHRHTAGEQYSTSVPGSRSPSPHISQPITREGSPLASPASMGAIFGAYAGEISSSETNSGRWRRLFKDRE